MRKQKSRIEEVEIRWDDCLTEFFNHLSNHTNARVLFSAPFGAGKSSFIGKFFEDYENTFTAVKLNPVNYVVASNTDVFELIKFDVLAELIVSFGKNLPVLHSEEFSFALRAYAYLQSGNGIYAFFKKIVSASGQVGKSGIQVLEGLEKLNVDFESFSSKVEQQSNVSIRSFISDITNQKGNLREMDDISEIISKCISELKDIKGGRVTVLIIEDLDRLDPEHIFRLFNIFSAHYSDGSEENKFGFDKVIFVCDIDNIRKMYAHRYGTGVDFTGYMNKFYSSSPFLFNSATFLNGRIGELLNGNPWGIDDFLKEKFNTGHFRESIKHILSLLITEGFCTLRMLDQAPQYRLSTTRTISPAAGYYQRYPSYMFEFFVLIDFLRSIYSSLEILDRYLYFIAEKYSSSHQPNDIYLRSPELMQKYIASICLELLLPEKTIFGELDPVNAISMSSDYGDCFIRYQLLPSNTNPEFRRIKVLGFSLEPNGAAQNKTNLNIPKIIYQTLKKCIQSGYMVS